MTSYLILAYTSVVSAFFPAIFGIVRFKKTQETLKILSVFCVITLLIELVTMYLGIYKINNMFLLHLYTPIEFGFIVFILAQLFQNKAFNIYGILLTIVFSVFCVIDAFLFESIKHFNSIPRGIEGIILICFCIYFFYKLFTSEETYKLISYPYFWLFSGWLFYFSGTFFLFIYSYQSGLNATFSIIHSVLNIFLNLIFAYTLWLGSKKLIQ